jgi:hypothetical protein
MTLVVKVKEQLISKDRCIVIRLTVAHQAVFFV